MQEKPKKRKEKRKQMDGLYAGAVFQNSPEPSALPIPVFGISKSPIFDIPPPPQFMQSTPHARVSSNTKLTEPEKERAEQEEMFVMEDVYYRKDRQKLDQMSQNLKNMLGMK